ncbi:uncharacterized protein LOC119569873 [Penaeus monodon]|uniref:uncharacterized protein LOC119569873 n=1 Tax=Penaeus monodon TaxID=6687 RepID=UPI0018A7B23B|nr:uncharacterized protein LOC119569873 [Penaeus monodon]
MLQTAGRRALYMAERYKQHPEGGAPHICPWLNKGCAFLSLPPEYTLSQEAATSHLPLLTLVHSRTSQLTYMSPSSKPSDLPPSRSDKPDTPAAEASAAQDVAAE